MTEACPKKDCEREFSTRRGLKTHYGQIHDGNAPWNSHTCENCGVVFKRSPANGSGELNFCSKKCEMTWKTEENSPVWKGGKVSMQCDNCGEEVKLYPSKIEDHQFCNETCSGEWKRKAGKLHYGPEWEQARLAVLERADGVCSYVGCKKMETNQGTSLHVHHLTPLREFDDPDKAHDPKNLVPLCAKHHRIVETADNPQKLIN